MSQIKVGHFQFCDNFSKGRDGVLEDCPRPRGHLEDKNPWPWPCPWPRCCLALALALASRLSGLGLDLEHAKAKHAKSLQGLHFDV